MDEVRSEWSLFKETWKNRVQKNDFEKLDNFINTLLENDFQHLEKIIVMSRHGKAEISKDKKILYLYKCPISLNTVGIKLALPTNHLFSPILDMLVNGIVRKNPKIITSYLW